MRTRISLFALTGLGALALTGQISPAQAATAQTIGIILDNTGSMTETGMAGISTTWKWDDAIMAAFLWVQQDQSDKATDREYSIWTFRNDTVIGGTQNGLKQIYPVTAEAGDCVAPSTLNATTKSCSMGTGSSANAKYQTVLDKLTAIGTDTRYRPVVGPNTPMADSICATISNLETLASGKVRNIIFESDGGENSSLGNCSGLPSADFTPPQTTIIDPSTWGMTLLSWQDKIVRRAVDVIDSEPVAVARALRAGDRIGGAAQSTLWQWRVDAHYNTCQPGDPLPCNTLPSVATPAALSVSVAAPSEIPTAHQAYVGLSLPLATVAASAATAATTPVKYAIPLAELNFFKGLGSANPKSSFRSFIRDPSVVYGTNHINNPGDVDDSYCVDIADWKIVHQSDVWMHQAVLPNQLAMRADLNRDGWVNKLDAQIVLDNWGNKCVNKPGPKPTM